MIFVIQVFKQHMGTLMISANEADAAIESIKTFNATIFNTTSRGTHCSFINCMTSFMCTCFSKRRRIHATPVRMPDKTAARVRIPPPSAHKAKAAVPATSSQTVPPPSVEDPVPTVPLPAHSPSPMGKGGPSILLLLGWTPKWPSVITSQEAKCSELCIRSTLQ